MKTLNKTLAKGTLGTVAAGAMALATFGASATPAMAKDRNGISTEDVLTGALIVGGIAVAAGALGGDRDDRRYRDRDYGDRYDRGYNYRGGHSQQAIQRCVTAVEREARRAGYRNARVTEIRDVDRERRGWEVEGRLEVGGAYGYNNRGYGYNHRGYGYDQRGWRGGGYDRGKFSCDIRRGRIVDIDIDGIRGLR